MDSPQYTLDSKELAKKYGYHVNYVRFLAAGGKIPALKRGRKWLFCEAEVLAYFKTQTNDVLKGTNDGRREGDGADTLLR